MGAVERYLDTLYVVCVERCDCLAASQEKQEDASNSLKDARRFREVEREVAFALNVARQDPRHFIPLVETKSPREGVSLVENATDFLRNVTPMLGPLCPNPSLSSTCAEAIFLLGRDAARHTESLSKFVHSLGFCAGAFGEMFWSSGTAPLSGFDVVTDFLLDDGAPSRSHRTGIFDADFHEVGVHVTRTLCGETVAFIHFADHLRLLPSSSADARETGRPQQTNWGKPPSNSGSAQNRTDGNDRSRRTESTHVGMKRETQGAEDGGTFIDLASSPERMSSSKTPRLDEEGPPYPSPHRRGRESAEGIDLLRQRTGRGGTSHSPPPESPTEEDALTIRGGVTRESECPRGDVDDTIAPEGAAPHGGRNEEGFADSFGFGAKFDGETGERPLGRDPLPHTGAPAFPSVSLPKAVCFARNEFSGN